MRITVPIVSAGVRWQARMSRIDLDACYPRNEKGEPEFDEAEFRRQVRDNSRVQIGSADGGTVLAFSAILLSSIYDWMEDNTKGSSNLPRLRQTLERFDNRVERGNVAYVRVTIDSLQQLWKGRTIRAVRVRITNDDRGTVQAERFDHDFALLVADFVKCYSDRYEKRGDPPLVMGEGMRELLAELHERTVEDERERRVKELNGNRPFCPRYCKGYCSPMQPGCPCYRGGKCVEVTEADLAKEGQR